MMVDRIQWTSIRGGAEAAKVPGNGSDHHDSPGGLEPADNALLLTVSDEGTEFPQTFPNPQGKGLRMRRVRTYSGFGAESTTVDRSMPFSKISVRCKRW